MVSAALPPVMVSVLATVAVFAKLPREGEGVLPAPRSIEALTKAAAPTVTVSAPAPPTMVSILAAVMEVGAVGESELVAAGAEIDGAAGQAVLQGDGIGAGATDQRVDVADGAGVGEVAKGQACWSRCRIDLHRRWRGRCSGVTVSLPVPPAMVSVLATVAELVAAAKVSVSLPAPRSMEPPVATVLRVMASSPEAADQGVDVADRSRCCRRPARVSLLTPVPRSICHRGGEAGAKGDGVGAGAAGDGLGVRHRGGNW